MSEWAFNIGEWTESYVFLRLLGQGRMYGATSEFTKDENLYIDILEILRSEKDKLLVFKRIIENNICKISISDNDAIIKVVSSSEFDKVGTLLYNHIKTISSKTRTFSFLGIQNFLESIALESPKPALSKSLKEKYGQKTDIIIKYVNSLDLAIRTEGFSIKSHLGHCPTLYNCSSKSQLVYEVIGCTKAKMYEINAEDSEKGIFKKIDTDSSLSLKFLGGGCPNFEDNISLCDSRMLELLDQIMMINIGSLGNSQSTSCEDTANELIRLNPLQVRVPNVFYPTLIKRFLFNTFGGMTASTPWDGRRKLTGGYIDVDKMGNILYYRAMSDDVFESYLFKNTKIDRPSRGIQKDIANKRGKMFLAGSSEEEINEFTLSGAKKGDWGYIYEKDGKFHIAINFQIRFK